MNTLTLFYDEHCGLCSTFRRWMLDQPAFIHLRFVPYDSPEALQLCPDLPYLRADQEIIVMSDEGDLWQGESAWVMSLWALREYREWSLRLAAPATLGMAGRVVKWISSNRIRLSHLLRLKGDADLQKQISDVQCPTGTCSV